MMLLLFHELGRRTHPCKREGNPRTFFATSKHKALVDNRGGVSRFADAVKCFSNDERWSTVVLRDLKGNQTRSTELL